VIHLTAPIEVLLERIASRGRDYEQSITGDYLREHDERYRTLFAGYSAAPVVTIDTTEVDFRDPEQVDRLLRLLVSGRRGAFDSRSLAALPLVDPPPRS
jgi:deoxyadenosine/deoxycytidine kinase